MFARKAKAPIRARALKFPSFTEAEKLEAFKFYAGEQWQPEILAQRLAAGRPVLTINRIFPIVEQIVREHRLSAEEEEACIVHIVRHAKDSQRVFNYAASELVERSAQPKRAHLALYHTAERQLRPDCLLPLIGS